MSNQRVAVLSVHTSPMDQPGSGDSGGMNVYIRAVAERLAEHDVEVDLFTRCRGADGPEILDIGPGVRLLTVKAGPCAPVPKIDLPRFLPEFLGGVLRRAKADGRGYDILHSHYWLSGWVGSSAKDVLGIPLVASFHTLGKVKNYSLARGEAPEPPSRLMGEERVIAGADRILAPTPAEAAQLVGLYRADPEHIRIVPPGVDHAIFFPRDRAAARDRLHLSACGSRCSWGGSRRTRGLTSRSARSRRRWRAIPSSPRTWCWRSWAVRAEPARVPSWRG